MISFFLTNIKTIGIAIVAFIGVYILKRNKTLASENQVLAETNIEKDKVINIQQKVLDVSENVRPTDLDGSLDRLQESNDKQ